MKIRIERLSDRVNLLDAMLLEHAHQLTIGQLHALAHCLGRRIRGFRRGLEAKLETVSHSQQLCQQHFGRVRQKSEERRVGQGWVSKCSYRWLPYNVKEKQQKYKKLNT